MVKVYNLEGKEVGEVTLSPAIFGQKVSKELVAQAIRIQQANAREPWAHTKTRGEVRGGGKKPWKQKGTGRARHGSSRSPIWSGGGVTFGPRNERNYTLAINKKMKKKALLMALSDKAQSDLLIIVDTLVLPKSKTKELVLGLANLKLTNKSVLLTVAGKSDSTVRASKNLKKIEVIRADSLNIEDVLKRQYLVLEKDSLPVIEKTYKV